MGWRGERKLQSIRKFITFEKAVMGWDGRALESVKILKCNVFTGAL